MRLQSNLKVILVVIFMSASMTAAGQSAPSATKGGWPIAAGGGISVMNPDYGHGAMVGITLWGDYVPQWVPKMLYGIGLEAEARDLAFRQSPSEQNLSEKAAGGGLIYFWMHYKPFHPYIKALGEYGDFEHATLAGPSVSQTRTVDILGGGFDYRVHGNIWARGDYEYQYWPGVNYRVTPPLSVQPQGFTVGVLYHFSGR